MAIIIFLFVFLFALYMILTPLFGERVAWIGYAEDDDQGRKDLEMQKNINLRALKDIQFERASGKINREDYLDLRNHYQRKAAQALNELEELDREDVELHGSLESDTPAARELQEGSWEEDGWREELEEMEDEDAGLRVSPASHLPDDEFDEGSREEDDWDEEENDMEEERHDRAVSARVRNQRQPSANAGRNIFLLSAALILMGTGLVTFEMGKKSGQPSQSVPATLPRTNIGSNQPVPISSLKIAGLDHAINYLRENPWNVQAHLHVGEYFLDEGDTVKALEHFSGAAQYEPDSTRVLNHMGRTYRQMGEIDLAIENFQAALNTEPSALEPRYHLGLIYGYDKGDKEKAAGFFRKILSSDPNEVLRTEVTEELKKLGITDG